jgi:hypothetical protein
MGQMQNRNAKPTGSSLKPWHIIVVVVLLLIGAVYYSANVMKTAYTVDPKKVFEEFFTNSLTRVTDLQGDGNISSMSDIWLTFYCSDVVRFRQPQFATPDRDRAWHYFTEHLPHDKDVANLADLEGWTFYDHPDPVRLINAWLLHNKKTNKYYFRTWGRK